MCCFRTEQATLGEVSIPLTSLHSNLERVQHAIRPNVAVHTLLEGCGLSGWVSPERHLSQFCVRSLGHHASTFLHPFAQPALTGFNATMSALTPAPSASPIRQRHRSPGLDQGSSVRSASNHLMMHTTAFSFVPLSAVTSSSVGPVLSGPKPPVSDSRFGLRQLAVDSSHHQAESSLSPADRTFVSGCSPPQLAVGLTTCLTQLPSTTGLGTTARRGLAPRKTFTIPSALPRAASPPVKVSHGRTSRPWHPR